MNQTPKKKSKAEIIMEKLFPSVPRTESPATAPNTDHQETALMRDLNAMQELENEALKRD